VVRVYTEWRVTTAQSRSQPRKLRLPLVVGTSSAELKWREFLVIDCREASTNDLHCFPPQGTTTAAVRFTHLVGRMVTVIYLVRQYWSKSQTDSKLCAAWSCHALLLLVNFCCLWNASVPHLRVGVLSRCNEMAGQYPGGSVEMDYVG